MQFDLGFRSQEASTSPRSSPTRSPIDLRAYPPSVASSPARWSHAIRHLDPESRLRVRELADLDNFDGASVAAVLRHRCWELRGGSRLVGVSKVDAQRRVTVPIGVRHQLGLEGSVIVSLAADHSRIVVWPTFDLDRVLEVRP